MTTSDHQPNSSPPTLLDKTKFVLNEKWIALKGWWNAYREGKTRLGLALRMIGGFAASMVLIFTAFCFADSSWCIWQIAE